MKGLNCAYVLGSLGSDPEFKTTESGMEICTFSIATSEKYKNKSGELVENTEWHKIVCYGAICKVCQYLKKGSKALVSGRIRTTKYQDKSGSDRYMTQIVCKDIILLSGNSSGGGANNAFSSTKVNDVPDFDLDDDLPF